MMWWAPPIVQATETASVRIAFPVAPNRVIARELTLYITSRGVYVR